jgi:hypothetical protein
VHVYVYVCVRSLTCVLQKGQLPYKSL